MSVLSLSYSWNSEGKSFELFWREDVVRVQISAEPGKNNYGQRYKARTIFDWCKKGEQKNKKDSIKSPKCHPSELATERLFH
jgi:hypothetical protein